MGTLQQVVAILDRAIGGPDVNIPVHGAFWRGQTRDSFVALKVRGLDLLVVGNSAASNLIKALKGQAPFGADQDPPPAGARFDRMPAGLDPVADADIAFIAKWIDDGCPADQAAPLRWRPTNAPVASSRTDDIWFTDARTGWAVNSNGQILKTTDGFDTYAMQFQDPDIYFRCVGFASPSVGWVGTVTRGKTLFGTRDGGITWTAVGNLPPLAPSAICGLSVVSEKAVFMSGTNYPDRPPRMMKTLDGGATWTAWDMSPWASLLVDTYFLDERRGWVVGGKSDAAKATRDNVKAVVLYTEDGGQSWTNRAADLMATAPAGEWGWKIQFLDETIGFVSLESFKAGAILKTTDRGLTWHRIDITDPQKNANLEGVGFIDERHGWVGGWGDAQFQRLSTSETLDGGATWRDANDIGKALNRFRFFGKPVTLGYASGQTVYKYSADPVAPTAGGGPVLLAARQPDRVRDTLPLAIAVPAGAKRLTVRVWDRFGERVDTPVDEANPAPGRRSIDWDRGVHDPGHFIVRVTVDGMSESHIAHVGGSPAKGT
jgi:photosystem II stability/assembly factor-like uncharacterized protein